MFMSHVHFLTLKALPFLRFSLGLESWGHPSESTFIFAHFSILCTCFGHLWNLVGGRKARCMSMQDYPLQVVGPVHVSLFCM